MRQINVELDDERLAFARNAAKAFRIDPDMRTYTDGPIEPDKWFALRWGADSDCVVVFKTHEYMDIVNYINIVEKE